uniref:Uncharacterized protein n=1 Tax=Rhizophora mucronata TaxID=61149 RepID=A0A2P2PU44_RHIMU
MWPKHFIIYQLWAYKHGISDIKQNWKLETEDNMSE